MINPGDRRRELIKLLDEAMAVAKELDDTTTVYLIDRALDAARAPLFGPQK
jgi:hypothetical protein